MVWHKNYNSQNKGKKYTVVSLYHDETAPIVML